MRQHSRSAFCAITVFFLILFSLTGCDNQGSGQPAFSPTSQVDPTNTPTAAVPLTSTCPPTITATLTPTVPPTFTHTPTGTATIAPTRPATSTSTPGVIRCPGAPELRLKIHDWAMVSKQPGLPNKIRSQPGLGSDETGRIPPGEIMLVESGPTCADSYTWWYVHSFNGLEGWTAEGDLENYWLIPLRPETKWELELTTTLTARQVTSAIDIESAIQEATAQGTRAGTVILDGRDGPFVFSGDDRTINIFVSNLSLVGVNQAVIQDCEGGLFFDDTSTQNILVEGIEFNCNGNGVVTSSGIQTVILRNNVFNTSQTPLNLGGAISDWLITLNRLETRGGSGMEIAGAVSKIKVVNNHISGVDGIVLKDCSGVQVRKNILHVYTDGVILHQGAMKNLVEMNTILGVYRYGIFLTSGVEGNQVLDNNISCKPGYECLTIYAPDNGAELNTIKGNLP